jgi:predicted signal transduction protein with EAL and GGDEF domain
VAQACDRLLPQVQTTIAMLEWAARHDPMTDLLNSASFKLAVQSALAAAPGEGALLVMGINELKKVNDSLGHAGGDQLLCAVADRLRLLAATAFDAPGEDADQAAPPVEPLLGRLGGDEFALFIPAALPRKAIERLIQKLQRMIGEPLHIGSQSFRVKLSIGVAMPAAVEGHYDSLLASADSAMARSRGEGAGGYLFYSPAMRRAADELLEREIDLRRALERGEFCLHYQPQFNLRSGKVDSVEALIRWNHPQRGMVYPGDFIPFAETYGLIDDIGDWVMLEAIRTAARWNEAGQPLRMSINVSPKQLYRIELIPMIRACLTRFGLPPHLLEIEITEAAITRNEDFSLERIEGLRRDGVSVALDDFGTGYSNLAQLMSLPMDRLKLDRSLIDHITTDRRQQIAAASMIGLANQLGFEIVAEGVEDQGQFDLLKLAGCDTIQGYFIAKPMGEADLFVKLAEMGASPEYRVA